MSLERERLQEIRENKADWKKWGPYLSERQWGTVREDYSADGNAWNYFTHEQARSRTYLRGEDGLAGISDSKQQLCFALALWNGKDHILKERLFGLTNSEGNHGEDVKEYYFYIDNTPTHSYMKYLYKYPQAEFPYEDLVKVNSQRAKTEPEYELLDTGIFNEDRYFDIFVEYAKGDVEDILISITACNRGPEAAPLHILPTLWFRNVWNGNPDKRPQLSGTESVVVKHSELGEYYFYCEGERQLLFTENETNNKQLFDSPNTTAYTKDAIHRYVVDGLKDAVNPESVGTKIAADYSLFFQAGESKTVRLRLTQQKFDTQGAAFSDSYEHIVAERRAEADAFYAELTTDGMTEDESRVMRQAYAGMLWSKQYYEYDVERWLTEHNNQSVRNQDWAHMKNSDIISMPDKWEYPWYATWDLAFHTIAFAQIDIDFAKQQLLLFLSDRYMHPNGQLPAYEWNLSDVNPPVHPYAVYSVYLADKDQQEKGDIEFLKHAFEKLELNFKWWLEHKNPEGKNAFEGGFLGLDNIGVFDRSSDLPTGGKLEQSDGTAWMVLFSQFMLTISLEIAQYDESYDDTALKYLNYFIEIASVMDKPLDLVDEMWDETDGFFYDVLRYPDGTGTRLKIRSLVGLLPMCASTVIESDLLESLPHFKERYDTLVSNNLQLTQNIACPEAPGLQGRRLLAILDEDKLRRVLSHMLDENEFWGPHGIRSLSRYHAENPYQFDWDGRSYGVGYLPGESDSSMFGGNSNWRGPIWMPINLLIWRSLLNLHAYYGDNFKIECPTGSGNEKTFFEISHELARKMTSIFLRNEAGSRPVYGASETFQNNPHWRDYILFYEYFDGDKGTGLGASHQTGWTGVVAPILRLLGDLTDNQIEDEGVAVVHKAPEDDTQ